MKHSTIIASFFTLSFLGAQVLNAGPLTPPAGPVASTYKTLTEVEPRIAINAANTPGDADSTFKITGSGSYYLTANMTGEATRKGIEILIAGGQQVTIDLNGFTMTGTGASSTQPAIYIDGSNAHVVVRNGAIRSWRNAIQHFIGGTITVEDVHASLSTQVQFDLRTATCIRCVAHDGSSTGFSLDAGTVIDCVSRSNNIAGFNSGVSAVTAVRCQSISNGGSGFTLGGGIAENCRSESNTVGFSNVSVLSNCTSTSNTGDGVTASFASTIKGCAINSNGGDGIQVSSGSRVEGNEIGNNTAHGINMTGSRTTVINNTLSSNGRGTGVFAGIFCSGQDNSIDGNHITNMLVGLDDFGVQVTGTSNLIVRNQISAITTTFSIVAGNTSGGASTTPSTAGPWANITY